MQDAEGAKKVTSSPIQLQSLQVTMTGPAIKLHWCKHENFICWVTNCDLTGPKLHLGNKNEFMSGTVNLASSSWLKMLETLEKLLLLFP